jgi:hypothetical protein
LDPPATAGGTDGIEWLDHLVNHNTDAEANVVLRSAWQYQRASSCPSKFLIAAANEIQVKFSGAKIKPVVDSNIQSSTKANAKLVSLVLMPLTPRTGNKFGLSRSTFEWPIQQRRIRTA